MIVRQRQDESAGAHEAVVVPGSLRGSRDATV